MNTFSDCPTHWESSFEWKGKIAIADGPCRKWFFIVAQLHTGRHICQSKETQKNESEYMAGARH
jgi:hypothetical protein